MRGMSASPPASVRGDERLDALRVLLREVWAEALAAVAPAPRVRQALRELRAEWQGRPRYVMAVGKAAHAMLAGAEEGGWVEAIVVGPARPEAGAAVGAGRGAPVGPVRERVGSHPVPDAASLEAAAQLADFVARVPAQGLLVALISGGGSAMVAAPRPGLTLEEKVAATSRRMAEGASIAELNQLRRALSSVKGGKLVAPCAAPVCTLVVSDVAGDDPRVVSSGLTVNEDRRGDLCRVIAGQDAVARAAAAALSARGWPVTLLAEPLTCEIAAAARQLRAALPAARGALVAYGEPVISLPPHPGQGGRAQQLALALARALAGAPAAALIAGSDGADGPSLPPAAGGLIDGATWGELAALGYDADAALGRCDARPALAAVDRLLVTGPTGRNHADAMLLLCDPP